MASARVATLKPTGWRKVLPLSNRRHCQHKSINPEATPLVLEAQAVSIASARVATLEQTGGR